MKYQNFVKKFAKKNRGKYSGKQLMKAAGRAWRRKKKGGSSRNKGRKRSYKSSRNVSRKRSRAAKKAWRKRRRGVKGYKAVSTGPKGRYKTHRNGILPYFAHNPVLPYFAHNPGGVMSMAKAVTTPNFWLEEVLPMTTGFVGTGAIGAGVRGLLGVQKSAEGFDFVYHGTNVASAIAGATASYFLVGAPFATRYLAAGGVYTLVEIISDLLAGTTIADTLNLGQANMGPEMKARIANAVRRELGMGDFATSEAIAAGPHYAGLGDFATSEAIAEGPHYSGGRVGQPAPMSLDDVYNEEADAALV